MKKSKKIIIMLCVLSILLPILNGQENCIIGFDKEDSESIEMAFKDIKKCHKQNVSITIRSYTKKEFNEIINLIAQNIDSNVFMNLHIQNIDGLDSLSNQLFQFKNLTSLIIENTFVTYFPPEIGDLKHLERLVLYNTTIREMPPEIEKNISLRFIEIFGTPIKKIPPGFINLPNLDELEIGVNDIQNSLELYDVLSKLPSLKKFTIYVDKIDELYGIDKLKTIENISIHFFNRKTYKYLFNYLKDLPNLKKLALTFRGKKINNLPEGINNLTNIEILKLYSIREIDNIKLPKLQRLIITKDDCTYLQKSKKALKNEQMKKFKTNNPQAKIGYLIFCSYPKDNDFWEFFECK